MFKTCIKFTLMSRFLNLKIKKGPQIEIFPNHGFDFHLGQAIFSLMGVMSFQELSILVHVYKNVQFVTNLQTTCDKSVYKLLISYFGTDCSNYGTIKRCYSAV